MSATLSPETIVHRPAAPPQRSGVVVKCYDFFDCLLPECGLLDMTEGMYYGEPSTPYEEAQENQINWLLDEVGCGPGTRILDIGCGNGTLLEAACRRGAEAVGITISPPQVERCRARGLDARLLDYREIPDDWNQQFDALVANGSIEHFVEPADAAADRADETYREMFEICHRIIDPASPSRRFATTSIHLHLGTPMLEPEDVLAAPTSFRWGTAKFHYALLQRGFCGFPPSVGQLKRCAQPCFSLAGEVDGTQDYHWTSEEGCRRAWRGLWQWRTAPRIWRRLLGHFLRHPKHTAAMFFCLFFAQSWQWQFRGEDPPTRLLRQTWVWQPAA